MHWLFDAGSLKDMHPSSAVRLRKGSRFLEGCVAVWSWHANKWETSSRGTDTDLNSDNKAVTDYHTFHTELAHLRYS